MKPSISNLSGLGVLSLLVLFPLITGCVSNDARETDQVAKESREAPKPVVVNVAPAPVPVDKGQQELLAGIASYENGNYKQATRQLQAALTLGLDIRSNRARAHKYLAFIDCVGGRQVQCRDEFRRAIDADPAFDLTPAEAGHPTWGPVFRKLKATTKNRKK